MTREEAIKAFKWFKEYNEEDFCGGDRIQDEYGDWYYRITEQDFEAFDMAIKALEQEPTTKNDLPKYCDRNICLKNEYNNIGCDDCEVTKSQEPVLDKIRAEIEETYMNITYQENKDRKATWGLRKALQIIDKYKAERKENKTNGKI